MFINMHCYSRCYYACWRILYHAEQPP